MKSALVLRRLCEQATKAARPSRVAARALFLLFAFLTVATSPGVGRFLTESIESITEASECLREPLIAGSTVRAERKSNPEPLLRVPRDPERRRTIAILPPPASRGHRLPNGLCAPLLR